MAEWLRGGLQNLLHRFNSGRCLQGIIFCLQIEVRSLFAYNCIMIGPRKWKIDELPLVVATSVSYRQVLVRLGLVPAGGNYSQVKGYIRRLGLDTTHFSGKVWNTKIHLERNHRRDIDQWLRPHSGVQSYKLKLRLFALGIKRARCELCGWAELSRDGRIPVELDHINGLSWDNRIENLRVLCPNCHSLQPTHRGKNRAKAGT